MPEKSTLREEYQGVVRRVKNQYAEAAIKSAVRVTPPAGRGSRNPGQAVSLLRARIRADIPDGKALPSARYVRGKAFDIENRGSYIKNLFVAPKGKPGRQARRHITPAREVFERYSFMAFSKSGNGRRESALRRRWKITEPVWVKAADWNKTRREKIAAAGGLLAAWAPVLTAFGIRMRLPSTPATSEADAVYDSDQRHLTLHFRSSLTLNGVPNFSNLRRLLN